MRIFIANASQPLKYVSCGNLLSKQGFLHPRRVLDTCVLILVKEGTLYIAQNDTHYEVNPNQYIFLYAGEEHYGFAPSTGKLSYLWVHFPLPQGANAISEEELLWRTSEGGKEAAIHENKEYFMPEKGEIQNASSVPLQFYQLFNLLHKRQYTEYIADYTLSLLIMEISQEFYDRHNRQEDNIPPYVVKIMDWIRANYDKPLSVTSIAREFSYNPDYLSALFSKTTNVSLTHYINRTRIDISKSLIVDYEISVKEAAYSCGFTDEKYFMKTFKKMENLTPTQYRKAFSKKA